MHVEGLDDSRLLATYVDAARPRRAREQAFLELVTRHERRVYAVCYRFFGNHADAEEATQDTFLALARRAEQFRGDAALSTWLYRVAVNTCRDLGRRQARRPQTPVDDLTEVATDDPAAEDELAARELATAVQDALLQLDDLSRTLMILTALEGYSYPEVSDMLDLPVGTIKSRVFRARARLAELLEDIEERPGPAPPRPDRPGTRDSPAGRGPRAPPT